MSDEWQDLPENDGLTLGPEEALAREIAKSKALKVERLRLKDQVEQLTARNQALIKEIEQLRGRPSAGAHPSPETRPSSDKPPVRPPRLFLPDRWAFFLLLFNLAAIGILLFFLLQRPFP